MDWADRRDPWRVLRLDLGDYVHVAKKVKRGLQPVEGPIAGCWIEDRKT